MRWAAAPLLFVVGLTVLVMVFAFVHDRGTPSRETIEAFEAQVVMPEGAQPLQSYNRFYSYAFRGWRNVVVGVFLTHGDSYPNATPVPGIPGAYTVRQSPIVLDGGCAVVTAYFDERAKRLLPHRWRDPPEFAVCNGV